MTGLVRFHLFSGEGEIVEDELVRRPGRDPDVRGGLRIGVGARDPARRYRPAYVGAWPSPRLPVFSAPGRNWANGYATSGLTRSCPARPVKAAGWHEAKTSRIELAKQAPSDPDIRAWCEICRVPDQALDLIAASRAADSMYQEWRRLHRTGMRRLQEARGTLYEQTRLFKVYMSTVVPGFLQTPGYAQALMSAITKFQGTPDDVEEAVAARMKRNRIVTSASHRFMMLIEESCCGTGSAAPMSCPPSSATC